MSGRHNSLGLSLLVSGITVVIFFVVRRDDFFKMYWILPEYISMLVAFVTVWFCAHSAYFRSPSHRTCTKKNLIILPFAAGGTSLAFNCIYYFFVCQKLSYVSQHTGDRLCSISTWSKIETWAVSTLFAFLNWGLGIHVLLLVVLIGYRLVFRLKVNDGAPN
jgi:hypothetical protein